MKETVFNLKTKEKFEREISQSVVDVDTAINNRTTLKEEKEKILNWLKENDWIPNKIVVGEWNTDDTRWTTYLEERTVKRNRLDELEVLLNGN